MKTILFSLPGNDDLTRLLATHLNAEIGEATQRSFPDGESYVRIHSEVRDTCVVMVCSLHQPDAKLLPLYFLGQTAKSMGARCTCLVAPYLAYMRQDKIFHSGEGISSQYFAKLLSGFADNLITVDPHLHRIHALSEIYEIPNRVIHAADAISAWISQHVDNPVLIGPDSESEQWVSHVAANARGPFTVLQKVRHGDRDVEVSLPEIEKYRNATPVLVDDIISTARTMIETAGHLNRLGMKPPICIGIHAVFSGKAYQELQNAFVDEIITCNTIPHPSNKIDLSEFIARAIPGLV